MSNAARKRGVEIDENMFDINTSATEGFGHDMGLPTTNIKTKQIIKSKPTDIFLIQPSLIQPRRVIPSKYREGKPIEQILKWIKDVELISGHLLPIEGIINRQVEIRIDDDNAEGILPEELPLLRLADLAASIHHEGLTNPITIVAQGDGYIIETGERRWMAYHLLHQVTGDPEYKEIPARRMSELNLWRQATENNARDSLNAIARARQVALLLMDLHGWDNFQTIDTFVSEQDFYAQVADGDEWRIPYGKSEQLCSACGFENSSRIRQFRSLLKLTHEQWTTADDQNIPERELRKWITVDKSVTTVTDLKTGARPSKIPKRWRSFTKVFTAQQYNRMTNEERQSFRADIEDILSQLDRLDKSR